MVSRREYCEVLKTVSVWPIEERLALAQEVLASFGDSRKRSGKRAGTLQRALGLAKTAGPAPSDDTVQQWIDEHRQEKYGG